VLLWQRQQLQSHAIFDSSKLLQIKMLGLKNSDFLEPKTRTAP
jgi:hypothetical protein